MATKDAFYLTTLNLAKFLYEDATTLNENESDRQVVAAIDAWKHADFLCKNYILNGLDNTLYNVYSQIKTARELWDSLDKNYKTKNAGTKKFISPRQMWWSTTIRTRRGSIGQGSNQDTKGGDAKRFKGKCFICDKPGHHAKNCRKRNDQGNKKTFQANIYEVRTFSKDVSDINLSVVVSKVNLVGDTKE
ncbi:Retrovirus-related Pol polyprotein from transposon TNT 1-94 [Fagus crenata]